MNNLVVSFPLFVVVVVILYLVSHASLNEIFLFLHKIFNKTHWVYSSVAVILFPGTIVHELSHFIVATILFLKVREVRILPEWKKEMLHLGSVVYEKGDFIRSIVVGIAPFFGASFFFLELHIFRLFPGSVWWLTIIYMYLIFAVSASMFSSKQDLVDVIYLIPLVSTCILLYYFFGSGITVSVPKIVQIPFFDFLQIINFYITIAIGIHIVIFIVIRSLRYLFHHI